MKLGKGATAFSFCKEIKGEVIIVRSRGQPNLD